MLEILATAILTITLSSSDGVELGSQKLIYEDFQECLYNAGQIQDKLLPYGKASYKTFTNNEYEVEVNLNDSYVIAPQGVMSISCEGR